MSWSASALLKTEDGTILPSGIDSLCELRNEHLADRRVHYSLRHIDDMFRNAPTKQKVCEGITEIIAVMAEEVIGLKLD